MLISHQYFEYAFYWSDGGTPPPCRLAGQHRISEVGFGSPQQATQFLRTLQQPHEFRMLLSERFPGQTFRWRFEELIAKMADLMVRRRLLVIKRWTPAEGGVRSVDTATPAAPRRATEFAPATESDTFAGNHDGDAQAETLLEAASNAEPFCEECEKARRASRPLPPPEPLEDPLPPDNDDVKQAQTLTDAASSGAAFCEECAKLAAAMSAAAAAPAEPPVPSLLPENSDEDKQAAALTDAAESGVPFCEECEKALAALNKAPDPPPESNFPAAHDEEAQAATLQKAAETGIPFCEECEKAKQQQKQAA
ncbi:MAG: hypothetical protein JST65_01400 [Acidobacteria bacterium]|nr:hypothetical protein [Acidobacteriota bacterium]